MALSLENIVIFLGLFAPIFTIMQGLAYLSYIVITTGIVGSSLCGFFVALLHIMTPVVPAHR